MSIAVSASSYLSGRIDNLLALRPDATAPTQHSGGALLAPSSTEGLTNADYTHLLVRDTVSSSFELIGLAQISRSALDEVANYLTDIVSREQLAASMQAGSDAWQSVQAEISDLEEGLSVFIAAQSLSVENLKGRFSALNDLSKQYFQADVSGLNGLDWDQDIEGVVEVDLNRLFDSMTLRPAGGCATCGQMHFMGSCGSTAVDLNAAPTQSNTNVTGATSSTASGVSYIEALRMGPVWDLPAGETLSYSYYNSATSPDFVGYPAGGVDPASAAYSITAFENDLDAAFDLWDLVSDGLTMLKVTETGGPGSVGPVGELRVAYTDSTQTPAGAAAYAYGPGPFTVSGDIWFDKDQPSNQSFTAGGYGFMTALHEIGHAIGLSHPFDGGSVTGATLSADADNIRNTLMSYTNTDRNLVLSVTPSGGGWTVNMSQGIYSQTPMLYDVAAIEYLYGGSSTTNATDTTYSWADSPQILETIVDSGGIDTIDASNQTRASVIDLTPGSFSSIGLWSLEEQLDYYQAIYGGTTASQLGAYVSNVNTAYGVTNALYTGEDNVGIAFSAIIENAVGGIGDDFLQGNSTDNELKGNAGNDTIIGGAGNDTAVFNGQKNDYSVTYSGSSWIVKDLVGTDGEDLISGVEFFEFSDVTWEVVVPSPGFSEKSGYIFAHGYMTQRLSSSPSQQVSAAIQNTISGSSRADQLLGSDANDEILAGAGDDIVRAGRGDDLIVAGSGEGNDIYFGGEGVDTIKYASAKAGVVVDLEAGYAKSLSGRDDARVGVDALAEIENVIGSSHADLIYGDAFNNVIDGNGGSDTIFGGAGEDTVVFSGSRHDYNIRKVADGFTVTSRDGVTTTLHDVELVQFSSGVYRLIDPNSVRDATTFKDNWTSSQPAAKPLTAPLNRIGQEFGVAYERSLGVVDQSRRAFDQAIGLLESQAQKLIQSAYKDQERGGSAELPVGYLLESVTQAKRLMMKDAAQAVLGQANSSQRLTASLLQA